MPAQHNTLTATLLRPVQARFPWVVSAVEDKDEEKRGLKGLDLLPDEPSPEARLQQLRQVEAWLGGLPFAGRPLVKVRQPCRCRVYKLMCWVLCVQVCGQSSWLGQTACCSGWFGILSLQLETSRAC